MNELSPRGAIRNEAAYALGKMLDHKDWQRGEKRLPRCITPSDADMVFDNYGSGIWCEVSRTRRTWASLERGQRLLYESAILKTNHCAALCKHSVPPDAEREINTRADIESFQIMLWSLHHQTLFLTEVFEGNQRWQDFVFSWYEKPEKMRRYCFDHPESERAMQRVAQLTGGPL